MFGKYKHTLDPKGRLFVPAKLREELGSAFYVARSLDSTRRCTPGPQGSGAISAWGTQGIS